MSARNTDILHLLTNPASWPTQVESTNLCSQVLFNIVCSMGYKALLCLNQACTTSQKQSLKNPNFLCLLSDFTPLLSILHYIF